MNKTCAQCEHWGELLGFDYDSERPEGGLYLNAQKGSCLRILQDVAVYDDIVDTRFSFGCVLHKPVEDRTLRARRIFFCRKGKGWPNDCIQLYYQNYYEEYKRLNAEYGRNAG
jgi:hypothetical protein